MSWINIVLNLLWVGTVGALVGVIVFGFLPRVTECLHRVNELLKAKTKGTALERFVE